MMLAKAVPATKVFPGQSTPYAGFLPFLYCTPSILRPYSGYQAAQKALHNAHDNGGAFTRPRKGNGSRHTPEDAGFKVNDPWEQVWKTSPAKRRSRHPKNQTLGPPQHSREYGSAQEEKNEDAYAPFGGWAGPATQKVNPGKPTRLQKDASHVPFQRMPGGAPREDPHAEFEGTTVTPNERKAFESLFKMQKPSTPSKVVSQPNVTYKKVGPDSEDPNSPLHPIIHKVSTSTPSLDSLWSNRPAPEFPEPLRKLREATLLAAQSEDTGHSSAEGKVEQGVREDLGLTFRKVGRAEETTMKLNADAQKDIFQVKRLMGQAESDVELWNLLQERVLRRIADLQLDAPMASGRSPRPGFADKNLWTEPKATSTKTLHSVEESHDHTTPAESEATVLKSVSACKPGAPHNEGALQESDSVEERPPSTYPQPQLYSTYQRSLEVLSTSFPKHLINAFTTLTIHFPASPLPLTLIPLIKSLGPSSAALGLSTELYNLHLREHWSKYRDLIAIDEILEEMNENVYEFDQITHNFVSSVLSWTTEARDGEHGPTAQLMSKMDRALRGEKAVTGWMKVMTRRRYDEALRKSQEKEAMERERLEEEENERFRLRMGPERIEEVQI